MKFNSAFLSVFVGTGGASSSATGVSSSSKFKDNDNDDTAASRSSSTTVDEIKDIRESIRMDNDSVLRDGTKKKKLMIPYLESKHLDPHERNSIRKQEDLQFKFSPTKLKNLEKQEDDGEKRDAVTESESDANEAIAETEEEKHEQKKKQEEEMIDHGFFRYDGKKNPTPHDQLEFMTKQPDAGYDDSLTLPIASYMYMPRGEGSNYALLKHEGDDPTYTGYDTAANEAYYDSSSIHEYAVATNYHDDDAAAVTYDEGRVDRYYSYALTKDGAPRYTTAAAAAAGTTTTTTDGTTRSSYAYTASAAAKSDGAGNGNGYSLNDKTIKYDATIGTDVGSNDNYVADGVNSNIIGNDYVPATAGKPTIYNDSSYSGMINDGTNDVAATAVATAPTIDDGPYFQGAHTTTGDNLFGSSGAVSAVTNADEVSMSYPNLKGRDPANRITIMNDDFMSSDLLFEKVSPRHLESRGDYCANFCPFERPKIQANGIEFSGMIYDCINSVASERRLSHCGGDYPCAPPPISYPGYFGYEPYTTPVCLEYLDYSNVPIGCWDTSIITDMSNAFNSPKEFNEPLDCWDVSSVTNMDTMFRNAMDFNQSLNNWDVSRVTNMNYMFNFAFNFNQLINDWDVSSVTDMNRMFYFAVKFNQSLNNWDVSSVTDMNRMFSLAYNFNQPLNDWDVSRVTNMRVMFRGAKKFNQQLNDWNVKKVNNMSFMFWAAWKFNQPVNNWNVSRVTDMHSMFYWAADLNQQINDWDVNKVTSVNRMFYRALDFNQPLNDWDVSRVTDMRQMLSWTPMFDQPINNWNVSRVNDMSEMFESDFKEFWYPSRFNQDINNWNVASVTKMDKMFEETGYFNQPLHTWNVARVTDMNRMFFHAQKFNQSIDNWNVANVNNMSSMFFNAIKFNQCMLSWAQKISSSNGFDSSDSSDSTDTYGKCSITVPCSNENYFCNFDYDRTGFCESCPTEEQCSDIGLPLKGEDDCFSTCFGENSRLLSWAEKKTPSTVKTRKLSHLGYEVNYEAYSPLAPLVYTTDMLVKTSCPIWWTDLDGSPDPDNGPWCQGVKDGCVIGTLPPTASPEPCTNSDDFDCSGILEDPTKLSKFCGSFLRVQNGKRIKVKNLCPRYCVSENLCTCVDGEEKFTIKGRKGKEFTCAKLKKNSRTCKKKKIGSGLFKVQAICPNKCNNLKNCLN